MKQLQEYFNQVLALIADFRGRNRQLFNLIAGTLGFALAIGAALYVINPGAPVVLVANLNPADRTALALRLRRHDIKFTLGADSITVGSRDVGQARAAAIQPRLFRRLRRLLAVRSLDHGAERLR
jgi:flagellar biosynthesis/type III secretory pathway M-ring protein FliF/YscJ